MARGAADRGQAERTLKFTGTPDDVAQGILSTLEGAMLVARPYGDLARFNAAAGQLLAGLSAYHKRGHAPAASSAAASRTASMIPR